MAQIEVACPLCQQNNVVKFGLTAQGKQRYLCNHTPCENKTFILDYKNKGASVVLSMRTGMLIV